MRWAASLSDAAASNKNWPFTATWSSSSKPEVISMNSAVSTPVSTFTGAKCPSPSASITRSPLPVRITAERGTARAKCGFACIVTSTSAPGSKRFFGLATASLARTVRVTLSTTGLTNCRRVLISDLSSCDSRNVTSSPSFTQDS